MNVPDDGNVRLTDADDVEGIEAGAPVAARKVTVCASVPKSHVTVPPVATVTVGGVKTEVAVAATFAAVAVFVPNATVMAPVPEIGTPFTVALLVTVADPGEIAVTTPAAFTTAMF